jgi:hypothetical protein
MSVQQMAAATPESAAEALKKNITDMLRRNNVNVRRDKNGVKEGGKAAKEVEEVDEVDEVVNDAHEVGAEEEDDDEQVEEEEEDELHDPSELLEQSQHEGDEELGHEEEEEEEEEGVDPLLRAGAKRPFLSLNAAEHQIVVGGGEDYYEPRAKLPLYEVAEMSGESIEELRARNTRANSVPTAMCPVCGDKANGLHYGIYTCEA